MTQSEGKRLGGFDKVLIGCGIGCAVVILFTVLAVAFGTMWIFTPGRQAVTEAIADDASLGVIRLHEVADDPGVQELFARVLERIDEANRKRQRERLPEALRWISGMQAKSDPRGLNMMIPREMTIAFEESADGEGADYVVAFNPRAMVRMIKAVFGLIGRADEGQEMRSEHAGSPVYRLDEGSHLAFVGSTVLFASSAAAVERAIDRLAAAASGTLPARRGGDLMASIPEGDWDVEGIVGNEAGLVDAFLAALRGDGDDDGDDDPFESLAVENLRLSFGFDVVSADEISGLTVLECADRQTAERLLAALEKRHAQMMEAAGANGLDLEIESRVEGERVVTEVRLVGLGEFVAEALTFDDDTETGEETEEQAPLETSG